MSAPESNMCSACKLEGCNCAKDTATVLNATSPVTQKDGSVPLKPEEKKSKKKKSEGKKPEREDKKWIYRSVGTPRQSRCGMLKRPGKNGKLGSGNETGSKASKTTADVPGAKFFCEVCGKTFMTKGGMNMHCHSKPKLSKFCKLCGMGFPFMSGLDRHERRCHPGAWDDKWSCEVKGCKELIWGLKKMDQHLKKDHGIDGSRKGKWTCEECGKGFFYKGSLKLHKDVVHDQTAMPTNGEGEQS